MLDEDQIIAKLFKEFPQQIGDDAAIIPISSKYSYIISKDLLIENIHFRTTYYTPEALAHKALHVNLSDIAAMGAKPLYVLLGISVNKKEELFIKNFLQAFTSVCKKQNVILIGGDTTNSPDKLFISVTAIGKILNKNIKFRNKAQDGDIICIAGNIGYAHIGLLGLEKNLEVPKIFTKSFLYPQALTAEGKWAGSEESVTSLMDISDGLYVDLKKLCQSSLKGAEINLDNLVISHDFINACQNLAISPLSALINGGEDYSLLMTINKDHYLQLSNKFIDKFGYKLQEIGKIKNINNIIFYKDNKKITIHPTPFSHF